MQAMGLPLTLLALASLVIALLVVTSNSEVHSASALKIMSKLCWKNATVRPPILVVVIVFGWAWVVRVCRKAGIDLDRCLGGTVQPIRATIHAAVGLLTLLLAVHLAHFVASEHPGLTWRPWLVCNLSLNLGIIILGMLPMQVFFFESRLSLARALYESIVAPFAPVTFWHVIVADYMTSLAKAFSDLHLTFCISYDIFLSQSRSGYVRSTELWHSEYMGCADTMSNAVFLALPFWWRLMQCLKVYSITRENKNLWNALKYSTAFPLVVAGYLRRHEPSPYHDRLFVAAAVVQSTYCLIWDVQMDWGLLKRDKQIYHANDLRRDQRSPCGVSLREPLLVTQRQWVYGALIGFDFCLRFIWALSVFGGLPGRGAGMFFFEIVEVGRRTVWAVFRIEWEAIVKEAYVVSDAAHVRLTSSGDQNEEDDDFWDD